MSNTIFAKGSLSPLSLSEIKPPIIFASVFGEITITPFTIFTFKGNSFTKNRIALSPSANVESTVILYRESSPWLNDKERDASSLIITNKSLRGNFEYLRRSSPALQNALSETKKTVMATLNKNFNLLAH